MPNRSIGALSWRDAWRRRAMSPAPAVNVVGDGANVKKPSTFLLIFGFFFQRFRFNVPFLNGLLHLIPKIIPWIILLFEWTLISTPEIPVREHIQVPVP